MKKLEIFMAIAVFYSELPVFKESQGRIACYDKLFYNEDGTIQIVEHTGDYLKE